MADWSDIFSLGLVIVVAILLVGLFISSGFLLLGARIAKIDNATFGKAIGATLLGIVVSGLISATVSSIPVIGPIFGGIVILLLVALITKWIFSSTYVKALLAEILRIVLTFIVGCVLVVIIFGNIFSQCGREEMPDYDRIQAIEGAERYKEHFQRNQDEMREKKNAILENVRKTRGERLSEQLASLETKDFKATFTTRGSALRSFILKDDKYTEVPRDWGTGLRDDHAKETVPVNLVTTNPELELNIPLRFEFNKSEGLDAMLPESDYEIVERTDKTVVFRYSESGVPVVIYKKFEIDPRSGPFQFWLTIQVTNTGNEKIRFRASVSQHGYQHDTEASGILFSNLLQGICRNGGETKAYPWNEEDSNLPFAGIGDIGFVGVQTNYFLSAMIPASDIPVYCHIAKVLDSKKLYPNYEMQPWGHVIAELCFSEVELKPGESKDFRVLNYMGPKRYELLRSVGHGLEESMGGWFDSINRLLQ